MARVSVSVSLIELFGFSGKVLHPKTLLNFLVLIYLYLITIFNERFIISLPAYKKGTQQLPCKLSNLLPFQKAQETEHP